MKLKRTLELISEYLNCKACGSEFVGNGKGTLTIGDDTFKRTCKCGWEIEVREDTNDN